jgi:hypothetical protein
MWISRLESGTTGLQLEVLPELASALGVSVEFLLYGPLPVPPAPERRRAA